MILNDIEKNIWYFDMPGDYSLISEVHFTSNEVAVSAFISLSLVSAGWSTIDCNLLIRPASELELAYYGMEHI